MKKFLTRLVLFTLLISAIILVILYQFGGYVDYFYLKFTSPPQHSMIFGDSRSFQGIQPRIINKTLRLEPPMYNYSFTLGQVAYGDSYLNSIKAKLDKSRTDGLFIISVHPWVLAERENENHSKGIFFESDLPPHNMRFPSMNPNVEYFFKNYSFFHFKAIFRRISLVHDDGWLELTPVEIDLDTERKVKPDELARYTGFAKTWTNSPYRLSKLAETVSYLQKYGKVILVRMPVSPELYQIESKFSPYFTKNLENLSSKTGAAYFDFSHASDSYPTYDGQHLTNESSDHFTKTLCDSINLTTLNNQVKP
ncbi:MAG TPA: hypothetical protein VGB43_09100 [Flavobacterium sp.]|jgi:hypothetical protein